MTASFTFNEKTSAQAYSVKEYNQMYVAQQEININLLFKQRGYIYLNQIFEAFGVEWDSKWNNPCYEDSRNIKQIEFSIVKENENGFDIDIIIG